MCTMPSHRPVSLSGNCQGGSLPGVSRRRSLGIHPGVRGGVESALVPIGKGNSVTRYLPPCLVLPKILLGALVLLAALPVAGDDGAPSGFDPERLLPPEIPWSGPSRLLVAAQDDPWITPAERANLQETPRYRETVEWLRKLAAAAPELTLTAVGKSLEGREIWMVVASTDGASPEALRASGKPILLAHGGIHSGEIDGKDAGLMLLRDLTVGKRLRSLLDRASLLFIPILNVDGHERFGPFHRVNQRGPREMGWRTNARNQNLNRDFAKLDTREVRALAEVINRWQPDLYLDLHVTDGADYQYDITFGYTGPEGYSPASAGWLEEVLRPALEGDLRAQGHVPGPLVFLKDSADPTQGNFTWTASPRYSNGYGDARHLPSVLVENHSLKPYDQRVLGTYVLLESSLRTLGEHGAQLRRAVEQDKASRRPVIPLTFKADEGKTPPTFRFAGVESRSTASEVSGGQRLEWTGKAVEMEIPWLEARVPDLVAHRPAAYWIPPTWPEVIDRLRRHGIVLETLAEPRELEVEMLRLENPKLAETPFEGHVQVTATVVPQRRKQRFPAGSVRVSTDQPLGDLAMLLLEPAAPDSFFQWGFFLEVLQRTEYMEAYALEALARLMIEEEPGLEEDFRRALDADPEMAANPRARLQWFYARSPYLDQRWKLYPVARELPAESKGSAP